MGTIARRPGSRRKTKISNDIKEVIEVQMRKDETTASGVEGTRLSVKHVYSAYKIIHR